MTNPIKPSLASLRIRPEQTSGLAALANWRPAGVLTKLRYPTDEALPKEQPVLGALEAHMRAVKSD